MKSFREFLLRDYGTPVGKRERGIDHFLLPRSASKIRSSSQASSSSSTFVAAPSSARTKTRLHPKDGHLASPFPKTKRRKQLFLDFGQKDFTKCCPICGMVYSPGEEEDESVHKQYCAETSGKWKFNGWKGEKVVDEFVSSGSRVIEVQEKNLSTAQKKKMDSLKSMAEMELGKGPISPESANDDKKYYLYVQDRRVVGILSCVALDRACRLRADGEHTYISGDDAEPASLGIERIWVHRAYRRKGIGSALLRSAMQNALFGRIVQKEEIAFSQPTKDGRAFAERFFRRSDFLVYG
eukprot:TRINITY_DN2488_c0_g2_i1.p1 TRINITY_DN2488_c0_g2~~TRINITY_DN2488_c0_g2_i1.p1  ORF type:complete len:314 (+),score=89.69 TRINITY_DN2488_c0_g2_i1:57-944(+)